MKTVMAFGVFDRLHQGHLSFLRQAKRYGKQLIVVVARDRAARELKHKKPSKNERARLSRTRRIKGVTRAVLGDRRQSSYAVIKKFKPDMICLGYDQQILEQDLKAKIRRGKITKIRLVRLRPYNPERLHTSILNRRLK